MTVGDQYRELMPQEITETGDEYMHVNELVWRKVKRGGQSVRAMVNDGTVWKYRRKLEALVRVGCCYHRLVYGDVVMDGDEVWSSERQRWVLATAIGQPILITPPSLHCRTYRRALKF